MAERPNPYLAGIRARVGVGELSESAPAPPAFVKSAEPVKKYKPSPMELYAAGGARLGVTRDSMTSDLVKAAAAADAAPKPGAYGGSFVAGSAKVGVSRSAMKERWQDKIAGDLRPAPNDAPNVVPLAEKKERQNATDVDQVFGDLDEEAGSVPIVPGPEDNPAQLGEPSPMDRREAGPVAPPQAEIPEPAPAAPQPGDEFLEFTTPIGIDKAKEMMARVAAVAAANGGVADPSFASQPFNLSDPALSPLVLEAIMTGAFGSNWHGWEPETLKTITAELSAMLSPVSQENMDKLQAYSALKVSTYPWLDFHVFEKVVMALNGASPEFGHFEDVSPGMLLFAVSVMQRVRPGFQINFEVSRYIACKLFEHGVIMFPDPVFGPEINDVLSGLAGTQITAEQYDAMLNTWAQLVDAGGLSAPPEAVDDLDEDEWMDRQILNAYLAVRYAAELQTNSDLQMNQLAGWAQYALGS